MASVVLSAAELFFTKAKVFFPSLSPKALIWALNCSDIPGRKRSFSPYFIHIIRICKLFAMTDEDSELKQLVPPVSLQEPTAVRYNCDDITVEEVGQIHGYFKTGCQLFFLLW